MSDAAEASLLTATAIVRATLKADDTGNHRAALEVTILELVTNEDPIAVITGLAQIAAAAIRGVAATAMATTADQILDMVEAQLKNGGSDAR